MKIGLVSDIHEDTFSFGRALSMLQSEACGRVYCLGDLVFRESGSLFACRDSASEVVALAQQKCSATVVGNHDLEMLQRIPSETPPGFEVPADYFSLDPDAQRRLRMRTSHPKGRWFIGKPTLPFDLDGPRRAWLADCAEVVETDIAGWRLAFMHGFKPDPTGFCVVYPDPRTLRDQMQWQRDNGVQLTFAGHAHEPGLKLYVDGDAEMRRVSMEEPVTIDPQRPTWVSIPAVVGTRTRASHGVALFDTDTGVVTALPLRGGACYRHQGSSRSTDLVGRIPVRRLEVGGHGKGGGACRYRLAVRNQFDVPGHRWLKGNLHCHPGGHVGGAARARAMADAYQRLGYDFLAATDHNLVTECGKRDDGFVVIAGAESDRPHLLSLGVDAPPANHERNDGDAIASVTEQVVSAGGLTILPHPTLTGWSFEELCQAAAAGVEGFEVVHAKGRFGAGKWRADQLYMMLLSHGYRPAAIGSDDCHWNDEDPLGEIARGRAWTGVRAAGRSPEAILDAIRLRQTYASEGPEIRSLRWEEPASLVVECSPCVACYFRSDRHGITSEVHDDAPRERFVLDLTRWGFRAWGYVVVVLQDASGRFAWTSPIDIVAEII